MCSMALYHSESLGRAEMESIFVPGASKDARFVATNNSWWYCSATRCNYANNTPRPQEYVICDVQKPV